MLINFVTLANESIASYRYHVRIPAHQLEQYGHSVEISQQPIMNADIYVFGKHWNYGDYYSMRGVQAAGSRAVFHVCDNHFNTPHAEHYYRMIKHANKVLASTGIMADQIKEATGRNDVKVVYDGIDLPTVQPSYKPNGKLKLFWQGHHSNLDAFNSIAPFSDDVELRIVTTPGHELGQGWEDVKYFPWSPETVRAGLHWCDVVFVPVAIKAHKLGKSHNRVTEGVNAGKFVIASEIDSYKPYKPWMHIGDIEQGLEWLKKADPDEVLTRIASAQAYAKRNYAPQMVGAAWENGIAGN
jgi:hypothetical protein